MTPPCYAELQCLTAFSFLRGASHAWELVEQASALGHEALGIADINTVAGVVRAHEAAKRHGLRLLPGCRLSFADATPDLICYPTDRAAWGRLTRLLSLGRRRGGKNACLLHAGDLPEAAAGQAVLVVPPERLDDTVRATLHDLRALFGPAAWLAASRRWRDDDAGRLRALAGLARDCRLPLLAVGDVLYHVRERRPLADVMACIRLGRTVETAGLALAANAERHLKSAEEMARLFRDHPGALARGLDVLSACRFSLDAIAYQYPDEPVPPGRTPDQHLAHLVEAGAAERYPAGVPPSVRATLEKELALIARLRYAPYFLTVHDIVDFARRGGILCQGRGSAANSAVCYCLGITAVDPAESDLLFERFVSAERREPPDIDVDFEHERREEVIQYIYGRYGRERAALTAAVIHYRPRMAIREVGKAMGLAPDTTAALATASRHAGGDLWPDARVAELGLDPANARLRRTLALARELVGFPRHLSQHVGGFVLTRDRLDEIVPVGPAAMPGRSCIEWDKDDIDTLGIMKVDVLALGMLSCIHRAFDILRGRGIALGGLADIPREDAAVYRMLQQGDSLGVFQVESRAQMNMLPRLRPERFYDLVIEVAIVRPGPIQGEMVHPYLRRRQGLEEVHYPAPAPECGPADELRRVLGRTLGVPLFQEQAMRIAIVAAGFTPEEANALRRAMATFRHTGSVQHFHDKMVGGMVARGYARDLAERCFHQIEGFGSYGFPESHAASFAILVYVSAWLKRHHPAAFACALLNAQPMGFYAPAQVVRDARAHGVRVREIDASASGWDCALEEDGALRLGLRMVSGFRREWAEALLAARGGGFAGFSALAAALPRPALEALAGADALRGLGLDRRAGLWHARAHAPEPADGLFGHLPVAIRPAGLPPMRAAEQVAADYRSTGLSLKAQPLRFLRSVLLREEVRSCAEANVAADGTRMRVAGLVLVRQRPGSAGGVVFVTLEDETGIANLVVWSQVAERYRRALLGATLLVAEGRIQRSPEGVVHLVAETLTDRSPLLAGLEEETENRSDHGPALQRARDFH